MVKDKIIDHLLPMEGTAILWGNVQVLENHSLQRPFRTGTNELPSSTGFQEIDHMWKKDFCTRN